MTPATLDGVSVATQASVFFDGKCVSHQLTLADGSRKSVGVILPATLTFNTRVPETMECVAGSCEYRVAGGQDWVKCVAGDRFSVPANTAFDIRVTQGFDAYHYICHFG